MNDLEQPMLSYYVIYLVQKIMQRTEKTALIFTVMHLEMTEIVHI